MGAEQIAFDAAQKAYGAAADLANKEIVKLVASAADGGLQPLLERVWPSMVEKYGETSAQIALENYIATRSGYKFKDGFDPTIPREKLFRMCDKLAASDLKDGDFSDTDAATTYLQGRMTEHMYSVSDTMLMHWAGRDPRHPRWALVPEPGACAWCLMLASRGFVYVSEGTLAPARHPHCRCTPTVSFSKSPKRSGFDPEAIYDKYKKYRGDLTEWNTENGYWKQKYQLKRELDELEEHDVASYLIRKHHLPKDLDGAALYDAVTHGY